MRYNTSSAQSLGQAAAAYCSSFQALQCTQSLLPFSLSHSTKLLHNLTGAKEPFVTLNDLRDNPGASHYPKRVGRGTGSGLGKTSGRGHKGQKARTGRSPKLGFEGGQTPLRLRIGKRGFTNQFRTDFQTINLDDISQRIQQGRLDPSTVATMHTLRAAGLIGKKVTSGVKLLGRGAAEFQTPLHLQVSAVSKAAQQAVEQAGGSVTTVYYNQLGLRALLTPDFFAKKGRPLPRAAGAPAKVLEKYDQLGQIPPDTSVPAH